MMNEAREGMEQGRARNEEINKAGGKKHTQGSNGRIGFRLCYFGQAGNLATQPVISFRPSPTAASSVSTATVMPPLPWGKKERNPKFGAAASTQV